MKKFLIIIWVFILINSTQAQIYYYLSTKNVNGGLMIGIEAFNQLTGNYINLTGFTYEWSLPDISLEKKTSRIQTLFVPLDRFYQNLILNLKISGATIGKSEVYSLNKKINVKEPKVAMARKMNGFFLPLESKVKRDESLVAWVYNSLNKNLIYRWDFNGLFFSSEKEIKVADLNANNGKLKITVFDPLIKKSITEEKVIQVE